MITFINFPLALTGGEVFAIAAGAAAIALLFLWTGAVIALWSYYTGKTGRPPVPEIKNPFRKEAEKPVGNHSETMKAPPSRGM